MTQESLSLSGYILSIVALVIAFFLPLAALILGVISLIQSSKQKNPISKIGKRISIIAIIVSVLWEAVSIYLYVTNGGSLVNFPSA